MSQKISIQAIREKFFNYFQGQGHKKMPSASLIPHNDKTLLFANAGMNQFKEYFTGQVVAPHKRVVTCQKCVRAGGKHNDLENVGLTARHHTFFEMMGNFSFGDYFKKEAILFSWEFLTKELKIPKEKLYVTVHHSDTEAYELWQNEIGLGADRIFKKGDKDNFWEMGEFGPCGPCSEIFYDHGENHATPNFTPGKEQDILDDEDRYIEIWNLVFMQFEKTPEGTNPLPNPCIDTGMGLERVAAVMQDVYWNYDTDAFMGIINQIEKISNKSYQDEKYRSAMRVIADHIRSATMLITDGVIPSNEGRGYVLRRILRRAIRYLGELEVKKVSLHLLAENVLNSLGEEHPQNKKNLTLAQKYLKLEEEKFLETLELGLKFLNEAINKKVKKGIFPGEEAFKLYDTYGFPLDLTEVILNEKNITLDQEGFDHAMKKRKEDSRKSWQGSANIDNKIFNEIKTTFGETIFLGYKNLSTTAKLLKLIEVDEQVMAIFDQTPFYGESGGQAGDRGSITKNGIVLAEIIDTQKPVDNLHIHLLKNKTELKEGEEYQLEVSTQIRKEICRHHSATHLLQAALVEVLGPHIKQAGSSVSDTRLRFDFTHPQAMTEQEVIKVETLVNQQINSSLEVGATIKTMDQAVNEGATALFGEKYGDSVRVLKIGCFSTELCGGTHVENTSEIGLFTILVETSLSSGIRRIEAAASKAALTRLQARSYYLKEAERLTGAKDQDAIKKIEFFQKEVKKLQRDLSKIEGQINQSKVKEIFSNPEYLKEDIPFISSKTPANSNLRELSDQFLNKYPKGVIVLYSIDGPKVSTIIRCGNSLKSLNCNKILKESLFEINGKGGGRPDMAQGAGDVENYEKYLAKAKSMIVESLL